MYNLLVTAEDGAWDKPAYEYDLDRAVQEYTVKSISEKYKSFSEKAVTDLTGFPSLFLYEIGAGDNARIGWIKKIRRRIKSVVIEYEVERAFPPIPSSAIQEIRLILDINEWEFNRTHWGSKRCQLVFCSS